MLAVPLPLRCTTKQEPGPGRKQRIDQEPKLTFLYLETTEYLVGKLRILSRYASCFLLLSTTIPAKIEDTAMYLPVRYHNMKLSELFIIVA